MYPRLLCPNLKLSVGQKDKVRGNILLSVGHFFFWFFFRSMDPSYLGAPCCPGDLTEPHHALSFKSSCTAPSWVGLGKSSDGQ